MQRAGTRSPIPDSAFLATLDACADKAGGAVTRHWDLPGAVVQAIENSGAWNAREPQALSNVVRLADTLVSRLGLTFGICNGAELDRTFGEGRALLKIDEGALRRLTYGFKERIVVLAGIRG